MGCIRQAGFKVDMSIMSNGGCASQSALNMSQLPGITLPARSDNPEAGAISHEWDGKVRWVHDVARTAVTENRVKLILAGRREAAIATLLEADEFFIAEIPAARTLIDVAADGSGVPDLRRADLSGSRGKRRIRPRDLLVLDQINDFHRGADLHASVRSARHRRFECILDIHDAVGLLDVILHSCEQILSARERQRRPARFQRGDGFLFIGRIDVSEGFH